MPKPPPPTTKARKRPRQARSRVTVDAIVEASARVLQETGLDELKTTRIAEVAGVSVGTLYQYFPNKESIVAALVEHQLLQDQAALDERLAACDGLAPRAVFATVVRAMATYQAQRAGLLRELLAALPGLRRDELVFHAFEAIADRLDRYLDGHEASLRADLRAQPERRRHAVFVAVHGLRGATNAAMIFDPPRFADPEFVEQLVASALVLLDPGADDGLS